ncbi:hypothetical protein TTHERM_00904060 (macronuclear) [Tetrahymena thermophila SB210]|uniref:Zinc carboxypeptidase family protein n=1 Tax=Tetrahymena thermophila (strain SB210) TaxID=312017 RepID=Q24G91_TETTS|nr:hypothetical protein TTHERM_00904060 [Tetrahymena thermophila SB210]EAS06839.3 hypothetical protein TTHERM_00904060 [Tetrahymena thermophila SB210]|eukprot:XP_001027081.3 hypothetical protein TTHERM_00904060 [Tetrahymena thermophila SB210]
MHLIYSLKDCNLKLIRIYDIFQIKNLFEIKEFYLLLSQIILMKKKLSWDNFRIIKLIKKQIKKIKKMNRNLSCNIHSNYPIYHIDILENSQKKLQCIKCVSYQQEEKSFLLIPEILNYDQKLLLQNWPPLNDETLRNKIISLENQENDLNQPIQDFYDGLIKDLTLILSEKKKEQLILAQKVYEFKEKIIQQYQQIASIDKIKEFFIKENLQTEKVEQDLKNYIDSQFKKKNQYTTTLSCMMQQYELIKYLDIQKPTKIKENVSKILQIINLIPLNNFNFESNIKNYKKKLEEEQCIQNKNNQILDNLIKQLCFCNEQLTQLINQNTWDLDNFLLNLQKFTIKNQIDSAELQQDIFLNMFKFQQLIENDIKELRQKDFKSQNEFKKIIKQLENKVIINNQNYNQKSLFVNFDDQARFQVQKQYKANDNSFCLINYILKPEKKYIFRFKAHKLKSESEFLIGIISDSCNKKHFPDDWIASDIIGNQDVSQGDQILNEENLIQTWQFQVCIKDKTFNMYNYPNFTLRFYLEEQSDIQVDGKYYFGVLFLSDYPGDKLEIFDYQELDEFPDS